MFSPLTAYTIELIHPGNPSGAQGNTGEPITGSKELGGNTTQNSNWLLQTPEIFL